MHSKKSGCCAKKTACCQQQKACADKPKVCCGGNKAEAPAPAPAHEEAEEEEPTFEDPKPKNPLDLLPTGKFSMDTWKRFYSNNETPESLKYFWDNFDAECYSMHHFLYKYNEELTKVFMSSNLIGGFYQRLDDLRKYLFGNMAVFGEDNNNMIAGAFIVRGGDIKACMADVPDVDSYHITAMDINDPEHRRTWEMFLAWEGDVNGKKLNVAKTFK
jgi:elongation factor 1-gamma